MSTEPIKALLETAFPDAQELRVIDRGGGDHFEVQITAAAFDGLSRIDQHRRIYEVLAEPLASGAIHELRIKTRGSAEA